MFDVSHMGQIIWTGKDALKFIEKGFNINTYIIEIFSTMLIKFFWILISVVVGDIKSLKKGEAKLSLIMNPTGGIVDDTVITNGGDHIYMVVNGACKDKDMNYFQNYIKSHNLDVIIIKLISF